jgi:acetolactate synthase-1/2/3 large subunit
VFNTEGLGPMGFGPPAALGGCLAAGRARTVCVDGDGGFAMNFQELETIRRLALPVKFLVLDNGGYGSIVSTQNRYFEGRLYGSTPEFGLTLPDPCRIAAAMDIATCELRGHDALATTHRAMLDAPGPMVCKVLVSAKQSTQPRVASRQLPDGRMVSAPMEELFPFLDPDEQRQQMFVPPPEEVS